MKQGLDDWLLDGGRQLLRFPRPSFPSGELKRGRDYWITQVAAGDGVSYAREVPRRTTTSLA